MLQEWAPPLTPILTPCLYLVYDAREEGVKKVSGHNSTHSFPKHRQVEGI
jgi:hypothetical protein